jgi:hypothetical protein
MGRSGTRLRFVAATVSGSLRASSLPATGSLSVSAQAASPLTPAGEALYLNEITLWSGSKKIVDLAYTTTGPGTKNMSRRDDVLRIGYGLRSATAP